jgi:hypothetical protein
MSFIEQKRSNIDDNAQTDFTDILNSLDNKTSEIIIREPLSGDIDCSVLKELHFSHVSSITFSQGSITSITNIPDKITQLICENNLLIAVPELPTSISILNLSGNGIKTAEFKSYSNLKEISISKNQIVSLYELPPSLEVLKCDNNQMKVLNLEGVLNLRVLHCSNNPVLTIEHLPDTIEDLQMENSFSTHISENTDKSHIERADYMTCLNKYFEIKQKYEKSLYSLKKIEYQKAKSKKIARRMIAQIRPKCINCNRPVGSLFETTNNTYIARCGDAVNPCDFDIQLSSGDYGNLIYLYNQFSEEIQNIKQEIIQHKMDTLFKYIDEKTAVSQFKKQLESYTEMNSFLKELEQQYNDIYFNEEQLEKIDKKIKQISGIQERFKENSIKDAMHIYINELIPEIKNLENLKYGTREMIESTLWQKPYRLSQLDYTFGSLPKVIKFKTTI